MPPKIVRYLLALVVLLTTLIATPVLAQSPPSLGGGKSVPTTPTLAEVPSEVPQDAGPPDIIRDPIDDPAGAISDVKPLWNKGWYLAVLAIMVTAARVAQKRIAKLRERESRWAMGITAFVTVGTAVILALTGVAEWESVFATAAIALGAVLWPDAEPTKTIVVTPPPSPPAVS